jgi:hypothetical protein
MNFQTELFQAQNEVIDSLCRKSEKKTKRFNTTGHRVLKKWTGFRLRVNEQREQMDSMCGDIAFQWPSVMKIKLKNFPIDGDKAEKTLGMGVRKSMAIVNLRTCHELHTKAFDNLANAKWLLAFLAKLRDFLRRSSTPCPSSCFKFIYVIQSILARGWDLTNETFFLILERVLTQAEDYSNVTVNKAIRAARDVVGVGPEEFLKYLEDRKITPCPELLAQIRSHRRKKARKEKIQAMKKGRQHRKKNASNSQGVQSLTTSASGGVGSLADFKPSGSMSQSQSVSRQNSRTSLMSDNDSNWEGTQISDDATDFSWDHSSVWGDGEEAGNEI